MAEYIDRDHYCKYICRCNGDKCEKTKCPIFTAPTADVAPVVHGEWIDCRGGNATCNQCRVRQKYVYDDDNEKNYCGHCGAKMDGGKK